MRWRLLTYLSFIVILPGVLWTQEILPFTSGSKANSYISVDSICNAINYTRVYESRLADEYWNQILEMKEEEREMKIDSLRTCGSAYYHKGKYKHYLDVQLLLSRIYLSQNRMDKYASRVIQVAVGMYRLGRISDATKFAILSYETSKKANFKTGIIRAKIRLAWIAWRINDCEVIREHLKDIEDIKNDSSISWHLRFGYYNVLSHYYHCKGDFINAKKSINKAIQLSIAEKNEENYALSLSNKVQFYEEKDSLNERIKMLTEAIRINRRYNDKQQIGSNVSSLGNLLVLNNQIERGIDSMKYGIHLLQEVQDYPKLLEEMELLQKICVEHQYYEKAALLIDYIKNTRTKIYGIDQLKEIYRIEQEASNELFRSQLRGLEKDQELNELKISKQNLIKNFLILLVIVILLFSFLLFRRIKLNQIRKNELVKEKYERELANQEIQALRAQMNPHFVFNSLNSIKSFIAKNEPRTATRFLNKFSRLIRLILSNSRKEKITIGEELEALELYLDIEKLRLDNQFEYEISATDNLESFLVPPLIIQPYVENAIWHGLMNKNGERFLKIKIKAIKHRSLQISIRDNGVGRDYAKSNSVTDIQHKSYGMDITKNRIAINNKSTDVNNVKVIDHRTKDGVALGTEVVLIIKSE